MKSASISPRARLAGIVCTVSVLAAIDTLFVRAELSHRPVDARLFVQSSVVWCIFAVLALVPTLACDSLLRRRGWIDASPVRAALRLMAWTAMPVLVHLQLDPYTEIGGSVSRLQSAEPWLIVAGTLLALGAATWLLGRMLSRLPSLKLGLATFVLATAAGTLISFGDRAPRSTVEAGAGPRPNVLLLVWDTTRAASLELFGYDRNTTPNLAKLAEDSLVFTRSHAVANYTLTSHISLLTGVYPSHHGAKMMRQRFDPRATPSVTSAFKAAGYRAGAFVGTDVLHAGSGIGEDFDVYEDEVDPPVCATRAWALVHDVQSIVSWKIGIGTNNGLPHWFQDFQRPAAEVLSLATDWIGNGDPRPWFCMINLYDVHWPYLPERSARERWVGDYDGEVDGYSYRADRYLKGFEFDEHDNRHLQELYDAELWELDHAVDAFLATLDLTRTSVLMTSDHGEAFGEGGVYEHHDLLETQLRVPLIVRPAGGVARRVTDAPTSGIDVAPTLLALAGLPSNPEHRGISLLGTLPSERLLLVEDRDHGNVWDVRLALYSGMWKLVRVGMRADQRWQLFDLARDPGGLVDVAHEHPDVVERLKPEMAKLRESWKADDDRDLRAGTAQHLRALRALGYVDGPQQ